jgi:hypothetical protein
MSTYVLGDNEPMEITLTSGGTPVDLTGASVSVRARQRNGGTVTTSGTVTGTGTVSVTWASGALAEGLHDIAVVVTFGGGAIRTYPSNGAWPQVNVISRP